MPWFSSDRTIREYAEDIWHVPVRAAAPVPQEPGAQRGGDGLMISASGNPLPPASLN